MALFYVIGVGRFTQEGMDLEVRAVAAWTREPMTQLEKGPFSIETTAVRAAAVHVG